MKASDLLAECARLGITLAARGGKLIVTPQHLLTPMLRTEIKSHQKEILKGLLPPTCEDCGEKTGVGRRCLTCMEKRLSTLSFVNWPMGCISHEQTGEMVGQRMARAEERGADIGICSCCGGPTMNVDTPIDKRLRCKVCERSAKGGAS